MEPLALLGPVDVDLVVHNLCVNAWRALITAHQAAHDFRTATPPPHDLPERFPCPVVPDEYRSADRWQPHPFEVLNAAWTNLVDASTFVIISRLTADAFVAPAAVTIADVRGSSAHAICLEAATRAIILMMYGDWGDTPILPAPDGAPLPGLLSHFDPTLHGVPRPPGPIPPPDCDPQLGMLLNLFACTRNLTGPNSGFHAQGLARVADFAMREELKCEWERLCDRRGWVAVRPDNSNYLLPVQPTPPHNPLTPDVAVLAAFVRLLTRGVSDERVIQAALIARHPDLSVNERLMQIDKLVTIPPYLTAEDLGELLDVSKQAVIKTAWWEKNRKGKKAREIERRRSRLRKQAKGDVEDDPE